MSDKEQKTVDAGDHFFRVTPAPLNAIKDLLVTDDHETRRLGEELLGRHLARGGAAPVFGAK